MNRSETAALYAAAAAGRKTIVRCCCALVPIVCVCFLSRGNGRPRSDRYGRHGRGRPLLLYSVRREKKRSEINDEAQNALNAAAAAAVGRTRPRIPAVVLLSKHVNVDHAVFALRRECYCPYTATGFSYVKEKIVKSFIIFPNDDVSNDLRTLRI